MSHVERGTRKKTLNQIRGCVASLYYDFCVMWIYFVSDKNKKEDSAALGTGFSVVAGLRGNVDEKSRV